MHRILVVGCLPGLNGITTCICNLLNYMDRSEFEWEFLVPERSLHSSCGFSALEAFDVRIHALDYTYDGFTRPARRKLLDLMQSIPDLCGVHLHDTGTLNVYPLYLADRLGLPVKVIQMHTSAGEDPATPHLAHKMGARRGMISGSQFDRLACSDLAGAYAYRDLPYTFFPNAVDTERFAYNPVYRKLVRQQLSIPDDAPVIGFVGNYYRDKQPLFAAKVFEAFHEERPDAHMILLGEGPLKEKVRRFFRDTGLSDSVHILGSKPEIELFYSAMDVLLCTSLVEGLPYAVVEAQAAGLPCLVSDQVSGMVCITPLVLQQSVRESPGIWAKKITGILQNRAPRRSYHMELKAAGYDIRDSAKQLAAIYRSRL